MGDVQHPNLKIDIMNKWFSLGSQTSGNPPVPGPQPVKTVEDRWKPLLYLSSCLVKNSSREPLYGDSNVEKIILGPVKILEDQ